MKPILIRCDASPSIGSGHVMRCRTLARELSRRGAAITFLCRRQHGDLIGLLEQEFPVLTLPQQPLAADEGLQDRALYHAWLGCNQVQDATESLQALVKAGIRSASWLVVDHYGLDAAWEAQMLEGLAAAAAPRLLVIDDLADRPHEADLLLDQNFFGAATDARYAALVPGHCRQLLGPHYALLGPEYAQLHPLVPPRTELQRVLVFFGGVDPANLTGRALEALRAPELSHLAVDVVLGLQSPHRQTVAELVARRPHTTLHNPLPSLAGLIARADLAIGAGGSTTWERACLGLPSLVAPIAANQREGSVALEEKRCLLLINNHAFVESLRHSLISIIADLDWLFSTSIESVKLTNGCGAKLISNHMTQWND
jgi:UDP-2,4-diacetamido-2,4,6-trideoxy-beta-L-altropyranose hydrolase